MSGHITPDANDVATFLVSRTPFVAANQFAAMVGVDTFDAIRERVHRLLAHRCDVTYMHYAPDGNLDIRPIAIPDLGGLHLTGKGQNWVDCNDSDTGVAWSAFYDQPHTNLGRVQIGFVAPAGLASAENVEAALAIWTRTNELTNVARVVIQGGGPGHDTIAYGDHIIVESYNEVGAHNWTRIDFHPHSSRN